MICPKKKVREVMDFIGYLKLKEDEWFIEFVNKRVPGGKAMSFKRTVYTSTLDALDALLRSLAIYEQKYQMSSDEFYASYLAGKLEDTKDFVEWAGDYQHYIELKREIEKKLKVTALKT